MRRSRGLRNRWSAGTNLFRQDAVLKCGGRRPKKRAESDHGSSGRRSVIVGLRFRYSQTLPTLGVAQTDRDAPATSGRQVPWCAGQVHLTSVAARRRNASRPGVKTACGPSPRSAHSSDFGNPIWFRAPMAHVVPTECARRRGRHIGLASAGRAMRCGPISQICA